MEKVTPARKSFFRSRLNQVLIAIICALVIALAVTIPLAVIEHREKTYNEEHNGEAAEYAVIKTPFADPTLLSVNNTWYAFATRWHNINVQVASATNISEWTLHEGWDALPILPSWTLQKGRASAWAPSVAQRPDGKFVLYFTALHQNHTNKHCLGTAVSDHVVGPYTPSNETLACNFDKGGIIDPVFFHDPLTDTSTVIYKDDGNSMGSGGACANSNWPNTPTPFEVLDVSNSDYITPLSTGNGSSNSNATALLTNGQADGPNIESPQLWYHTYEANDTTNVSAYHMLYNSGCFADPSYRIQHLVCWTSQLYPQQKSGSNNNTTNTTAGFQNCDWQQYKTSNSTNADLLLKTGNYTQPDGRVARLYAPGGPAVSQDGKYMAFHADLDPTWFAHRKQRGLLNRIRGMFVAELEYSDQGTGVTIKQLIKPGR